MNNPTAVITFEDGKVVRAELMPEYAPNTVASFVALAESGFYNGLIFHRIIDGFMLQGGDPTGTGMGGPGYSIPGEFRAAGFGKNTLSHKPGVISMARSQAFDSAGSQFFICTADDKFLDGQYAAFGKCDEESTAMALEIATVDTDMRDKPKTPVVMKSVAIERNGYEPPEVVKA